MGKRGSAMAHSNAHLQALETASAIILSISALASSLAVYQASLWDGEQAAHYSRANALRTEASRAALEGDALAGLEARIFGAWLEASVRGDKNLADFYLARFPPGLKLAFNAWVETKPFTNPAAPPTPFAMPAYRRPGADQSRALDKQADATFKEGQYANAVSDAFQQSSTMLAVALFFGGIGQVFTQKKARLGLLVVAGLALAFGLLRLLGLPMEILGLHAPAA